MQRASRRRWERRPASAIPAIHGSGAPTRAPMAFSGTGSRRAGASAMSAAARCRRHAIRSAGDHAGVSGGSAPGRSATASRCTCSGDSPTRNSLLPPAWQEKASSPLKPTDAGAISDVCKMRCFAGLRARFVSCKPCPVLSPRTEAARLASRYLLTTLMRWWTWLPDSISSTIAMA